MKEVEIKKVVLKIGKREINLTLIEAKKLFDVLGGMFKTKVIREEYHYPYWRWWWTYPHNTINIPSVWIGTTADNSDSITFTNADYNTFIDGSCLTVSL